MAARGQKAKNLQLKVIQGNPGGRKLPEPVDLKVLGAEAPDYLTDHARMIWNRWAASLVDRGLFADVHKELLAATVQAWALYEECMAFIREYGVKGEDGKRRPELVTAEAQMKLARLGMSELGLSPAELGRLHKPKDKGKDFFGY